MSGSNSKEKLNHSRFENFDAGESLFLDEDLVIEEILENMNSTPLGQVLKRIASLPESRQEKVLNVRQRIAEGDYEVTEHLDVALDKVLEDLTA